MSNPRIHTIGPWKQLLIYGDVPHTPVNAIVYQPGEIHLWSASGAETIPPESLHLNARQIRELIPMLNVALGREQSARNPRIETRYDCQILTIPGDVPYTTIRVTVDKPGEILISDQSGYVSESYALLSLDTEQIHELIDMLNVALEGDHK